MISDKAFGWTTFTRNLLTSGTLQGYIDTLAPSLIWRPEARTSPSIRPKTCAGPLQNSHLGDFIEHKNTILPIDAVIQSNLRETTTRVLASVTPREERVLRMRFGIGMNKDHTLEEVGQQFSVTRERIRQIEAKALRKLKHPSRSRILRSFLDN